MVLNLYLPNGKIEVFSSLEAEAAVRLEEFLSNQYDALTTALFSKPPYLVTTSEEFCLIDTTN